MAERAGLSPVKTRVIDAAFQRLHPSWFADLGGVWAVDAGYTFYALETHRLEQAFLVDEEFTPPTEQQAERYPELKLIPLNFGTDEAVRALGRVGAVLHFHVLLHQVAPTGTKSCASMRRLPTA